MEYSEDSTVYKSATQSHNTEVSIENNCFQYYSHWIKIQEKLEKDFLRSLFCPYVLRSSEGVGRRPTVESKLEEKC